MKTLFFYPWNTNHTQLVCFCCTLQRLVLLANQIWITYLCVCVCVFSILPSVFNMFPSYSSQRQHTFTIKTTSRFSKWHNLLIEIFFEIKSSLPADKQHNFNAILRNHCDDNSTTQTGRRSMTDRRRLKRSRYSIRSGSINHCNIRLENVDLKGNQFLQD